MRANTKTPDGIEIIAREPALGPHPHPKHKGRMVPFNGVSKVLLVDGTEGYECDFCGDIQPSARQVVSHRSGKHTKSPKRSTDVEVVKTVLRILAHERAKAHAEGRKEFNQAAADELNKRGLTTYHGLEFTAQTVNSLHQRYKAVYKIRVPRIAGPRPVAADVAILTAPLGVDLPDIKPVTKAPEVDEDGFVALDDDKLFAAIHKDLQVLRDVANRLEMHVLTAEDRARQRSTMDLDDEALRALESLRRAWQNS